MSSLGALELSLHETQRLPRWEHSFSVLVGTIRQRVSNCTRLEPFIAHPCT